MEAQLKKDRKALTPRQREVFEFIKERIEQTNRPPTPVRFASFGVFNGNSFVSELNDGEADGFNTSASSLAMALDSTDNG